MNQTSQDSHNETSNRLETVYPNYGAEIDEKQFEQEGAVRLENMCPHCGSLALYAQSSPIGYWISCASIGCNGAFNKLCEKAYKHKAEYYRERGVSL